MNKQHVRKGRHGKADRRIRAMSDKTPTQVWNETEKRWDKV